jgi:hypothetical protein
MEREKVDRNTQLPILAPYLPGQGFPSMPVTSLGKRLDSRGSASSISTRTALSHQTSPPTTSIAYPETMVTGLPADFSEFAPLQQTLPPTAAITLPEAVTTSVPWNSTGLASPQQTLPLSHMWNMAQNQDSIRRAPPISPGSNMILLWYSPLCAILQAQQLSAGHQYTRNCDSY